MRLFLATAAFGVLAFGQQHVTLKASDGGVIQADLYGAGPRGLVLAHGGRFNKESWAPQARVLAQKGFRVLALDFRGYGQSHGPGDGDFFQAPFHLDALAAIRHLRDTGATSVSLMGGSFGGNTLATAAEDPAAGAIDRIVLLAGGAGAHPERLRGRKLLIIARNDANDDGPRLPRLRPDWEKVPEPKRLVIVDGSAHAQFLFGTDQAERVLHEIVAFLTEP